MALWAQYTFCSLGPWNLTEHVEYVDPGIIGISPVEDVEEPRVSRISRISNNFKHISLCDAPTPSYPSSGLLIPFLATSCIITLKEIAILESMRGHEREVSRNLFYYLYCTFPNIKLHPKFFPCISTSLLYTTALVCHFYYIQKPSEGLAPLQTRMMGKEKEQKH